MAIIADIWTGGNQMEKKSQEFSAEEAMRIAKTPEGQQMLEQLGKLDRQKLQQVADLASAGDFGSAQKLLLIAGRAGVRKLVRHSIKGYIAQEALRYRSHFSFPFFIFFLLTSQPASHAAPAGSRKSSAFTITQRRKGAEFSIASYRE